MALAQVGKVAPAFSLLDQRGKKVSLKEFQNSKNVVLYFYPKAMTPGCTVQACGIRDSKKAFDALDTVVLAVSPDSVDRLVKFEDKQELNFTLLSDEDHAVTEKFGAWGLKKFMGREFMGVLRSTFIIGKDGRIAHVMDKVKTKTHHEDALSWVQENLS
ncbi:MAG: thioredoxin-dependent thiol peroxidase [Porticoccaceae bacterium]|nr:thioredoxin-dependent thiol peroxidase [Porticoccaceae bacterium]MBT7374583.1 thioredoxin-dependent thiol peroxidase [Porticoccaceae bacterium]